MSDFKRFEDIPVSTKTFIVMTNIEVNIQKLHSFLPITRYTVIQKKRGRKKDKISSDPNKDLKDGSIISVELESNIRGVSLKKKKKHSTGKTEHFRNSVAIIMIVGGKKINFKVSRNGKFQMTGCKSDEQAENCIKYVWNYIKDSKDIYTLSGLCFRATFIPAMRNIDFNIGFIIDRSKLDSFFNSSTEYMSLLETNIGYTGVNIKMRVDKNIEDIKLRQIIYRKNKWLNPIYVPYSYYLDTLSSKEKEKKINKVRYNTFLVFHSGKIIMSSMCKDFAEESYYIFKELLNSNRKDIEEKLLS